ncbi:hypothetical protein CRV08_14345 [Halarcobacter ebronensis]|uniref:Uncharacterized protein n=1 Tax=Halarcobacter ebronensis TaxID=1462615 RepID=A0A4V1LQT7_9BACT|nr:hypothetical protein [Halarcobacter ebronensis]RXJ65838.1 hypothetical protein CRV08_14345 [Halarcobacter ebronensis]
MSRTINISTLNDAIVPNAIHIYILVPGTTDPINSFTNIQLNPDTQTRLSYAETTHRSNSYQSISQYWDDKFYQDMLDLEKNMNNFILFDKFGWSGDNCVSNRETAGKYLVRRLCMKDQYNTQGYYEGLKEKTVYFHLVGHSHGGNVINEMTKEIDSLAQWPQKWKVKSIIYLSTPFFNKLHQVKVTPKVFHKEASVLHVYNDYDLTQNFLADFSLFDLSLIQKVLEEKRVLTIRGTTPTNEADKKGELIQEGLIDQAKKALESIPADKFTDLWLNHQEGEWLYSRTIRFLESVESVFTGEEEESKNAKNEIDKGIFEALKELNKEIEYNVSDFLKETIPKGMLKIKRQILKDDLYQELLSTLEEILQGIRDLKAKFEDTKRKVKEGKTNYSRWGFIQDLNGSKQLIETLTSFLDMDESSLISNSSNSLWNILFKILDHNIDQFDNTYVNPTVQFQGTFLEDKLEVLDVTKEDEYDKKTAQKDPEGEITQAIILSNTTPLYGMQHQMQDIMNPAIFSKRYYQLLENIKTMEKTYEGNPNQTNLMQILFTLIAHSPVHSLIDKWANTGIFFAEVLMNNDVEKSLDKFKEVMNKLKRVFNKNFVGNLEAFNMGSLIYFLQESHSTSRRYLHSKVEEFIKKVMEHK